MRPCRACQDHRGNPTGWSRESGEEGIGNGMVCSRCHGRLLEAETEEEQFRLIHQMHLEARRIGRLRRQQTPLEALT